MSLYDDLQLEKGVHRMIAAPTGGGKSYFVGAMVEGLYEKKIPFIIFDTKVENHIGLIELPDVKKLTVSPKFKFKNLEALLNYPYILCVPASRNIDIKDIIEIYREILSFIWLEEKGKRIAICEEAHNWNKNASVPDPLFERIAREGRGAEKYIWFVTQRLQNFSQLLWAQCELTYLMHFHIPSDIRYASQMIPEFDWKKVDGKKVPGLNYDLAEHDVLIWDGREYRIIKAADVTRKTEHKG